MNTQVSMTEAAPDDALHETALRETALRFARAALHWRRLSGDRQNWAAPGRQREMAQVFLRFHRAKLALEALTGPPA